MNPFKTLVSALATFAVDFRAKVNPLLDSMPKLESIEAAEPIRDVLRMVKWAKKDAEDLAAQFENQVGNIEEMLTAYTEKVKEEAISAAVEAKTHFTAEAHDAALTAAKTESDRLVKEAKDEAETNFNAKLDEIKLLAERRAEAVTRVGEIAAATLTDEVLAGDKHEAAIAAVEGRVTTLRENHITEDGRGKLFASLVACEGEAFTAALETQKEAFGGEIPPLKASTGDLPAPPKKDEGAGLAASGEKQKVII